MRAHLPLVRAMARRYAGRGEEFDDLVQAGSVGLVKASARFDSSRGVAFATFVAPAVEGEIRRHLRERAPGVRIPREVQRMSTELRRCRSELAASLGRAPDIQELAAALDADVQEVERLIAADLARDPIALGSDSAFELPGDSEPLAESEYRVLLAGGLRALGERERRIVFLRFHADMTERQIGRSVGISQAHVSRLLDGALTKLRAEFSRSGEPARSGDTTRSKAISPEKTDKAPESEGAETRIAGVGTEQEMVGAQTGGEVAQAGSSRSPRPKSSSYSGRFLVRMPSELHEQLALAAEREEVSLNRYVTDALSNTIATASSDSVATTSSDSVATTSSDRVATTSSDRVGTASPGRARPAADTPGAGASANGSDRVPAGTLRMALATNLVVVVVAGVVAVVLMVLALERGI